MRDNTFLSYKNAFFLPLYQHLSRRLTYFCVQQRIKKLVDIWERGSTFPASMLSSFKEKLNASGLNGKNLQTSVSNSIR